METNHLNVQAAGAPTELDLVVDLITANVKCESVYLFGSRARGEATKGSDIDLIVVTKPTEILHVLLNARCLRRRLKSLPVRVDIHALTTLACSRNKTSLTLNVWYKKCGLMLLYGKDCMERNMGALGFVPSRESFLRASCYTMRWFLRYIEPDGLGHTVDRRGLTKLVRFLRYEVDLVAGPMQPLLILIRDLEREANFETPDPGAVCRALANYVEAMASEFSASFPSRILQCASILADKRRFLPRTLFDQDEVCLRITKSLLCLYRGLETNPPNSELIHLAASHIDYLLNIGIRGEERDSEMLWVRVRNAIRQYWDTVMRVPFGTLLIHNPFEFVLH